MEGNQVDGKQGEIRRRGGKEKCVWYVKEVKNSVYIINKSFFLKTKTTKEDTQ